MNLKTKLAVFVILLCAIIVHAENLEIINHWGWKFEDVNGSKTYSINYSGKGLPGILTNLSLHKDMYYLLSWKAKGSVSDNKNSLRLHLETSRGDGRIAYKLSSDWNKYYVYLYNSESKEAKGRIYLESNLPQVVEIKDIELVALSDKELGGNLLPDSDFEDSNQFPVCWFSQAGAVIELRDSMGFLSGEKSLEVSFPSIPKGWPGIKSLQMPVIPGKEYCFTFWAKSERNYIISVVPQIWSRFKHDGRHFFKFHYFKITSEWKEYSVKVEIPADASEFPDQQDRLMFISILGSKNETGKVWFDGLNFKIMNK